jgi:ATP-dependent helicase/nuclease subunit B
MTRRETRDSPNHRLRRSCRDLEACSLNNHVGDVEKILEWARHAERVANLVLAPVELHRRNLKIRLTEAGLPLDAFSFTGPTAVASRLLTTAGESSKALDRIDRLSLLSDILADENEATKRFRMVLGGDLAQSGQVVEQARTELETTTNYHPDRVDAFRRVAESHSTPINVDASDVLGGTLAVERELRRRSDKAPSDGGLIRRATRTLVDTDGTVWENTYGGIDRIALVGLSNIPATYLDLLAAVAATCDVEVHVFLRRGTGKYLEQRLSVFRPVEKLGRVVVA